jgi:4-hydroxybenzoyl-CoA reductase subunit beta
MMRLPPFKYIAPTTLSEAAQLLADHGPEAAVVAGGTDLYPNMKRRQIEPKVLVGTRAIRELRGISGDEQQGFTIRANMTLTEVSSDPRVVFSYPAVARAAGLVSTVHLRNMGTLGGNLCLDTRCNYYNQNYEWREALGFCKKKDGQICWVATASPRCWAVSSSDTAPVMVALGAKVRLVSARGERVISAADLYNDDGIMFLGKRPDEILSEIILPPAADTQMTYWKLRRRGSFDFPILGVAVALDRDNGSIREGRIVLGAVSSAPVYAAEASKMLAGQKLTPELIDAAAEAAWRPARPLDNTDLNYAWRKRMARVYVRRALRELAGLPIQESTEA